MTTAATALNIDQILLVPPSLPANSQSPNNYLNRCTEQLMPEFIATQQFNTTCWGIVQKIAIVALVFFIVAVAIGVGVGAFSVPIYGILAGVGGAAIAYGCVAAIQKYTHTYIDGQREFQCLQEVAQGFNSLPNEPQQIAMKLASMAILWSSIPGVRQLDDLSQFKPLIAHYDYWIAQKTHLEEAAVAATTQAVEAHNRVLAATEEEEPNLQAVTDVHRQIVMQVERAALICKVRAAFIHAVIKQPDFARNFDDLAKFVYPNPYRQALAQHFDDTATANHFVKFRRLDVQALTRDELKALPITVIAQRFIQAMAPPA